ncbi:MAG TPA: lipopolysaccharide assembly protein LapA domain-containing protein [Patescibacteria group bacterium]|nr:lipopolysaccharide assembly protein LapA domain-containing protein [Patescibacteria group bacterium]
MKRWIVIVLALLVALLAAAFALLNEASVRLDFHFFAFEVSLGVVVMISLLAGFLLASAALSAAVIVPQRLRLRTLRRQLDLARQGGQNAS